MAKKSKRLAAKRSTSTKRKKGKAGLSQRQVELSGVATPAPTPAEEAPTDEVDTPELSDQEDSATPLDSPQEEPQPQPEVAIPAAAGAPWRYAYVLSDIKRIGLITSVVAVLLAVLTFVLR